ncbi:MAG: SOS response-associated peptidase [Aridibacter sp.]|jgi:putative SOS response-associated peptidase YedK|nr:SOS response-associated peptidase [Acidobacteriota bacterium]
MCGRFTQKNDKKTVEKKFDVEISKTKLFNKSYNIAPTQIIGAIRVIENAREYANLKWGLIPHWSKDDSFASKLINARAETLAEKASFRDAYKKRRCLIPASGFYEWEKTANGKQPHYFYLKDKGVFGFGGLWEEWLDKESGELIETFTIITTEANEVLEPIHNRMPVIIKENDYEKWLNESVSNITDLLKPFDANKMTSNTVSKAVNTPTNNSPELILNSK